MGMSRAGPPVGNPGGQGRVAMEFFSNPLHLMLLVVIVVLLFGASKLGDVGGALGKSIREFKKEASVDDGKSRPQVPPPTSGYVPPAPPTYNAQPQPPTEQPRATGYVPADPARQPEFPPEYRPVSPP